MAYLTNPDMWGLIPALLVLVCAATVYINRTTQLSQLIEGKYPELWDKMYLWRAGGQTNQFYRNRGRQIDTLVLYNVGRADHPDDPQFRRILKAARWSAVIFLIAVAAAAYFFGEVDIGINGPMR